MKKEKEETHQESFQLEIRVRRMRGKKEKEVGNKSQGRVGEWHRKKEKAEERASGTCKH